MRSRAIVTQVTQAPQAPSVETVDSTTPDQEQPDTAAQPSGKATRKEQA